MDPRVYIFQDPSTEAIIISNEMPLYHNYYIRKSIKRSRALYVTIPYQILSHYNLHKGLDVNRVTDFNKKVVLFYLPKKKAFIFDDNLVLHNLLITRIKKNPNPIPINEARELFSFDSKPKTNVRFNNSVAYLYRNLIIDLDDNEKFIIEVKND
jgi:hypothetical protein